MWLWYLAGYRGRRTSRQRYEALSDYLDWLPAWLWLGVDAIFFADLLNNWWGGPLNGQSHRQLMVREILSALKPSHVVETGSFRGTTTRFLASHAGCPVHSVEINRKYHFFARWTLRRENDIHLKCQDSIGFLRDFADRHPAEDRPLFFYLDAHWHEYLPLRGEIDIILGAFKHCVILIDDFEVPSDHGYGFDNYGPGKALTLDYLSQVCTREYAIFYPALNSSQESGAKRGSIVLATNGLARDVVSKLASIRFHGMSG